METSTNMKKETFHKNKRPWFANVKIFLMLLSLMFFAKAFSGSYMKSTITSIERRFDLPSSVAGMVDSGFEIGNLLVMAFVSYFGAKFHRPRVIAIGATIMSIGTLLIAVPHFLMDRYTYESISAGVVNVSNSVCETENPPHTSTEHILDTESCQHKIRSKMWILVLVGNMLRGIGETPIGPLGISYVDDFARPENSGLYLGCLFSVALIGPIFGFLMGSFTTKVFVDIGFVPMEEVTITPKDNRWVGAWWLGFLVTGIVSLLVTLPFWFFPRSVDSEMEEPSEKEIHGGGQQEVIANGEKAEPESQKVFALAKGFLPSLRELFINSVYLTMLVGTVFQLNGLIGFITFQAKFIEQQFGESASRANFLIGAVNLPAVALGIFCGGVVVKRCKLSMSACAKMAFITGLIAWLLGLGHFLIRCENIRVPGLTTTYNGLDTSSSSSLLSSCNARCHCKSHVWDPVCGRDGITYLSPCMGGCQTMVGSGKTAVFEDCQCVAEGMVGNATATLGPCPRERCFNSFILLICVEVLAAFISCLGYTPTYLIFIRSIPKQLKAFALGMQTLAVRTLAGIPAPIYFGAALDQTCIKWMVNACSMRGACRLYNVDKFRVTFFSMMSSLRFVGLIFILATIKLILRRESKENEQAAKENGQEDPMQPLGPSNGKAGNETLRDLLTTQVLGEVNGPSDALKASDVCVDGALTEVDEESIV